MNSLYPTYEDFDLNMGARILYDWLHSSPSEPNAPKRAYEFLSTVKKLAVFWDVTP